MNFSCWLIVLHKAAFSAQMCAKSSAQESPHCIHSSWHAPILDTEYSVSADSLYEHNQSKLSVKTVHNVMTIVLLLIVINLKWCSQENVTLK